jgi:hypothetical protein
MLRSGDVILWACRPIAPALNFPECYFTVLPESQTAPAAPSYLPGGLDGSRHADDSGAAAVHRENRITLPKSTFNCNPKISDFSIQSADLRTPAG